MYSKIETERLSFRKIEQNDYDDLMTMFGDIEVMYAWEHSFDKSECLNWIEKNIARYEKDGISYLRVSEKSSGKFVGTIGALIENIDGTRNFGIGYILKKNFWGKGYALEGANACLNFCFETLNAPEVIADIRPCNLASIKVAYNLGMSKCSQHIKLYRGKQMPHDVYKITSTEYYDKKGKK